jgi:iron complex outermembrane receptor protein
MNTYNTTGSADLTENNEERRFPRNQISLRSSMDLPGNLELDAALYYVDPVTLATFSVPSYTRLDLRLGWQPLGDDTLDVSIVGQNLLEGEHREFGRELLEAETHVQRGVFALVRVKF